MGVHLTSVKLVNIYTSLVNRRAHLVNPIASLLTNSSV